HAVHEDLHRIGALFDLAEKAFSTASHASKRSQQACVGAYRVARGFGAHQTISRWGTDHSGWTVRRLNQPPPSPSAPSPTGSRRELRVQKNLDTKWCRGSVA